jgi:LacI family transcriptional regulator
MNDDLSRFSCQNANCPDHGLRDRGNLTVAFRYGKDKRHRMLSCRTCRYRFSERKGSLLFGSQLTDEKAASLLQHLAGRDDIHATARRLGVNPNTAFRYSRLARQHPQQIHDELAACSA